MRACVYVRTCVCACVCVRARVYVFDVMHQIMVHIQIYSIQMNKQLLLFLN